MQYKQVRHPVVVMSLVSVALLVSACGSSSRQNHDGPASPELHRPPSPLSLGLDLSLQRSELNLTAASANTRQASRLTNSTMTSLGFVEAATLADVLATRFIPALEAPVFALRQLAESQAHSTNQNQAGEWVYSVDLGALSATYKGAVMNVRGKKVSETDWRWSMRLRSDKVSLAGESCCDDVELATATISSGRRGIWQFFDTTIAQANRPLFSVKFEIGESQTTQKLHYEIQKNTDDKTERFGLRSSLDYQATTDQVQLTYHDANEVGEKVISWSRVDQSGRYTDEQGTTQCWLGQQLNFGETACSRE